MPWYWTTLIVIASIIAFLFLVSLAVSFGIAVFVTHPKRYSREDQKAYNAKMGWDSGVEVYDKNEPIEFRMDDGYLIHGDYDLVPDSNKYCLLAHGHQTTREGARRYALIFRELGFSTIVYDERGHGDNVRCKVTMGHRESKDLSEIISQVYEKFGHRIELGVQGVSMGAFTVLMSTKYCQDEAFLVSDCAYSNLKDVIASQLRRFRLPRFPFLAFINLGLMVVGGFSFKDCDVREIIKSNHVPTLFIHGEADVYVPVSSVKVLYDDDLGKKEMATFPNAVHASSITVDRARYKEVVSGFLKEEGFI